MTTKTSLPPRQHPTAACVTYKVHLRSPDSQEHLERLVRRLIDCLTILGGGPLDNVNWDLIDCEQVWYTDDADEAHNHGPEATT